MFSEILFELFSFLKFSEFLKELDIGLFFFFDGSSRKRFDPVFLRILLPLKLSVFMLSKRYVFIFVKYI